MRRRRHCRRWGDAFARGCGRTGGHRCPYEPPRRPDPKDPVRPLLRRHQLWSRRRPVPGAREEPLVRVHRAAGRMVEGFPRRGPADRDVRGRPEREQSPLPSRPLRRPVGVYRDQRRFPGHGRPRRRGICLFRLGPSPWRRRGRARCTPHWLQAEGAVGAPAVVQSGRSHAERLQRAVEEIRNRAPGVFRPKPPRDCN